MPPDFITTFETHVAQAPQTSAAHCETHTATYAALNAQANRLAHHLRAQGVGPEQVVGVYLERSLDALVALLAIMKAGGVYLPLDPAYPRERLAFILSDIRPRILLTHQQIAARLPEHAALQMAWEALTPLLSAYPDTNLPRPADPLCLAYVIYTSGSTGQPKGVGVSYAALTAHLAAMQAILSYTPDDHVLQFAALHFDASLEQLLTPLIHGARVTLRGPQPWSIGEFTTHVAALDLTVCDLPPAYWHQVVYELAAKPHTLAAHRLRLVIVGGDVLQPETVRLWRHGPLRTAALLNAYGPTETVITATTAHFTAEDAEPPPHESLTIGRAVGARQTHILDAHGAPVSNGTSGELYIGGDLLARGYIARPALTAERFVPDPFSTEPGARLYRTGDRARLRPDDSLEFLGRVDFQVKIRGFRIELGEIEAALLSHPAIRACHVLARDDAPQAGGRRLVAYVVPATENAPAPEALRAFLKTRLPDYMLPAAFVFMEALPLLASGKVDRPALPAPHAGRPALATDFVAPRTATEETIASIWAEILELANIGIYDNFFELGGHSLAATQVIARLRDALQVDVSLLALFEAPTVAGLAAHIGAQQQAAPLKTPEPIHPAPRVAPGMPLSFAQERAWFMDELEPNNPAYRSQDTLRFYGQLDIPALEHALSEIVRRHEIYRTTFQAIGGMPVQVIHPHVPLTLPLVDLRDEPAEARTREVQRLIAAELQKPIHLNRLPLIRWILVRLTPTEHLLIHIEHHILHDGWSSNVFLGELFVLYRAYVAGHASPLAENPLQFADYAAWERQWIASPEADAQLEFWKRHLAHCPPILEVPGDYPRPSVQTFRGAAPRRDIPLELCDPLRELSRREGVTLFMTLLAAYYVLLYRYTGQADLLIGSGVANRRRREVENLIGMMVNNVMLRTNLSGQPTFREVLHRVRETTLTAYNHQDYPFDGVVRAVQPVRDPSRNPLFQVMFSFHDTAFPIANLPGVRVDILEGLSNGSAKFDFNLIVIPQSETRIAATADSGTPLGGITILWEYNADLYAPETIEALVTHYHAILASIVADPGQAITRIPLLTAREHSAHQASAGTRTTYPAAPCLHTHFERQAQHTPDAPAVTYAAETLTYAALNARANQLAHYLRAHGVGPETLVALYLERSLDLAVAILAVLKAGGAYVPLDPAYPPERVQWIVDDAHAPVLLTHASLASTLPTASASTSRIALDTERATFAAYPSDDPQGIPVAPDNLAYVIYTSGSTGRPKGVMIRHAEVVRLLTATHAWYQFDAHDVWTLFHSYAFDFSVWELWGALCYGGRLVIVPYDVSRSPEAFHALLQKEGVTVLNQTPSAFRQLSAVEEQPGVTPLTTLRTVIFGGEALDLRTLAGWFTRHADDQPQLVNMYGITETTVHVTYRPLRAAEATSLVSPIGVAIPDLQLYVLDPYLNPVPDGVPGELYVGGAGLARGYLNRPALTAERFVPDAFGITPGARLYRTGDSVRYRRDGALEYLGRIDQQVKLRGFRIELGEIEATLAKHPTVREAAVVLRQDSGQEPRLVAYLVTRGMAPAVIDLRRYLQARLPEYMVPAAFVMLAALPLTANGKLDRRALPAPDAARPELDAYVAPHTEIELYLASLWSEMLGVSPIGLNDDFLHLGGHSLLAARIMARIRETFHVDVALRTFFANMTIAGLAHAVETAQADTRTHAGAYPAVSGTPELNATPNPQDQIAALDTLSEDDLNALLGTLLADEQATASPTNEPAEGSRPP